jgi:hypothetical protein
MGFMQSKHKEVSFSIKKEEKEVSFSKKEEIIFLKEDEDNKEVSFSEKEEIIFLKEDEDNKEDDDDIFLNFASIQNINIKHENIKDKQMKDAYINNIFLNKKNILPNKKLLTSEQINHINYFKNIIKKIDIKINKINKKPNTIINKDILDNLNRYKENCQCCIDIAINTYQKNIIL